MADMTAAAAAPPALLRPTDLLRPGRQPRLLKPWTGCIAGVLDRARVSRRALRRGASGDVEIRSTHRVHAHAAAAIIRARQPR